MVQHCSIKNANLDSTDDTTILSESLETLVVAIDAFTNDQDPGLGTC